MPPKVHLRFDDGLTTKQGAESSPSAKNLFTLPSSSSASPKPTTNGIAPPKKQKLGKNVETPGPHVAAQSPPPNPTQSPLSNRARKKLEKQQAWEKKIAEREAEARAVAEGEGRLEEYETEHSRKEDEKTAKASKKHMGDTGERVVNGVGKEEVDFLRAKRKRQRERDERQTNAHSSRDHEANSKKKRKTKNAAPLPSVNHPPLTNLLKPSEQPKEQKQPRPKMHKAQFNAIAQNLRKQRVQLPIWDHQDTLRMCLRERDVLVMLGQTGSGKSTQIGQFLVNEEWMKRRTVHIDGHQDKLAVGGCIAITQPRRVAATNLARRVAAEMGVPVGEEVGYAVRFDNKSGPETKIKFLTDGMLLQEMLLDPLLKRYSAVVVDEAHERTIGTDLAMGFLRRLVYGPRKGNLKVIVMSATLEVGRMAKFFDENRGKGVTLERINGIEEQPKVEPPKVNGVGVNGTEDTKSNEDIRDPPRIDLDIFGETKKIRKKKDKERRKRLEEEAAQRAVSEATSETPSEPTAPVEEVFTTQVNGYFGSVATFHVPGRQYPVEIYHTPDPVLDYVDAALRAVFQTHYGEPMPGDILVFLTGQEEIEALQRLIEEYSASMAKGIPKICVLPLYAALPPALQQKVFQPAPLPNMRKVILATNIAETSITVSGVRHVIDCGHAKTKEYRPKIGLDSLLVTPISRSSAMQRTGRAGREAPGKCFRLYTESTFHSLIESTPPEILRTNVANAILTLKARGQDDVMRFDYLDRPSTTSMRDALEQLTALGALDINNHGKITELGLKMAKLPLSPPLARVLLAAADPEMDCLLEVIDIIAALSVENIFLQPHSEEKREEMEEARQSFRRGEGDHLTLLNVVRAYDAQKGDRKTWAEQHFINNRAMQSLLDIRKQLRQNCTSLSSTPLPSEPDDDTPISPEHAEKILKCFLRGFYNHTAKLVPDGGYRTVVGTSQDVGIHPSSTLFGARKEGIVYHEYVYTSRAYARWCSAIQLGWIQEAAPQVLAYEVDA